MVKRWTFLGIASGLALLVNPGQAMAQQATANAQVVIVTPLSVQRTRALEFGILFGSGQPGAIVVSPLDSVQTVGGVRLRKQVTPQAARFSLQGQGGRAYHITLPASVSVPGTSASGSPLAPLLASDFRAYLVNAAREGAAGSLNASGADQVYVGARLNVPRHASEGRYTLLLSITADYD